MDDEKTVSVEDVYISSDPSPASTHLKSIWRARELLYFLIWKEVKVRYKQTIIGAAWALIQPLVLMTVFSIFFGKLARLPSNGIPYPLFYFAALVPWTYFSNSVNGATNSIVVNGNLVQKVYFPRSILPLASVTAPLIDFAIALVLLLAMSIHHGGLRVEFLLLPVFTAALVVTAIAVGFWTAALNAAYRDLRYAVPVALQLWMFVSPVAYSTSLVPERWRWLYDLNPLVGIIEGFRYASTGTGVIPSARHLATFAVVVLAGLIGARYFWRTEATLADIV